ncbi:SRPBCC domain-containing protein [Paenibacillus sp. GCM10028914]|uniref:SRPBCC family protein n=1 Tax=Paenibacillus sp. GCM10028914 TaxID=3273416 RepID=UPI003615E826
MHTQDIPEIRKTVVVQAPAQKVWSAVSTSEGIADWWMANTFEPMVGYEFLLHAGQFGDSPCTVTEVSPLKRVSFNWGKDWNLTFEIKQLEGEQTEFTLIHSGWDAAKVTEFGQPHAAIREVMNDGWENIINKKFVPYVEG